MKLSNKDLVRAGFVAGVHGIKGELRVQLEGELPDGFFFETVFLAAKGVSPASTSGYNVAKARPSKGVFLIKLEGVDDRNTAETLAGLDVYAFKAALPGLEEGEYYYSDLIGMEVWADDGRALGRVTGIIETGSNDVIEVKGTYGLVLIPAIEQCGIEVDREGRKLTVHLLEGLLPDEK